MIRSLAEIFEGFKELEIAEEKRTPEECRIQSYGCRKLSKWQSSIFWRLQMGV